MSWPLIGRETETGILSAMIKTARLPHALLFTGPEGGGKNSLARSLAAALNCASPAEDGGPCGQCGSCLKVAKDIHPDLKTLTPGGRSRIIKMEDIQTLRGEMAFRPFEGRVKVFIIRQADRLGSDAGNALLKTLEEPPPDSLIILTSASEGELMTTILSRCLRLRLPPLPYALVLGKIRHDRNIDGPEAELLAALAAGALGPALTWPPEEIWARWQEIDEIMAEKAPPDRLSLAWKWVGRHATDEENRRLTLKLLQLWWRMTFRLAGEGEAPTDGPPPSRPQADWAARLTPAAIQNIGQALSRLDDSLGRFVKPELAFENYWLSVFSAGFA